MAAVPLSETSTEVASTDGRAFRVRAGTEAGLRIGDYLSMVDGSGQELLGFLEALDSVTETTITGIGTILPRRGQSAPTPFQSGRAERADPVTVERFFADAGAALGMGTLVSAANISVGLVPSRLNRHTFWCGQSGSGKTYALGVALEQVLLQTRLPIVIFDPNSDFVRLGEPRSGAGAEESEQIRARDIRVVRPGDGPGSLRIRFRDMTMRAKAALLRVDPLIHRSEYNAMLRIDPTVVMDDPQSLAPYLRSMNEAGPDALAERLENLGVLDWRIWAGSREAVTDVIAERPAATVLDLGGFDNHEEQLTVALAVLNDLWARREERRPVLLVIDEAHNLCSPDIDSVAGRAVRDQILQIAAEGRKFGLWLLLSTQRPSKVHLGIVSQCDNLTLMRMNSPNDLAELGDVFGFVPRAMLNQSSRFRPGEALLAGGFVPAPSIITVRERITVEGGIDVKVPMPTTAG